jgi:sensor histidine kinase regulating citrate/malate metabolism
MNKVLHWVELSWNRILGRIGAYRNRRETELLNIMRHQATGEYEKFIAFQKHIGDIKNYYRSFNDTLRYYLDSGQYDKATAYLDEIKAQTPPAADQELNAHSLINAVIGYYADKAKALGARMNVRFNAERIGIAGSDLYSILSKLLTNALEACAAMPEGKDRFIDLIINTHDPYFNIGCTNSKSGDVIETGGKIKSTKTGEGYGYSIPIIANIVDAYNGLISITHDENTFTLRLALKDK